MRIEQTVGVTTDDEHEDAVRSVIAKAEETCLVAVSLALPVQTTIEMRLHAGADSHTWFDAWMTRRESRSPGHRGRAGAFLRAHPAYAETAALDQLRRTDFARLDDGGHTYLDYTGGGLFAASQLREHVELLQGTVLGNPHSINPTSSVSTELVERARAAVLRFFDASEDEYVAIFTPNATGALRLVGEAYPFRAGDRFLLTFDNHNSVNGIREFARARGAETTYVPSVAPDLRVDGDLLPR